MLQSITILFIIVASLKVSIPKKFNATYRSPKLSFKTKSKKQSTKIKTNANSNVKTKWRGIRPETLKIASKLLAKNGQKLLKISQRSSDQAAKRHYHSSNQDGLRKLLREVEALDNQLNVQRTKSLEQISDENSTENSADKVPKIAKKKPGRSKNPEITKSQFLKICKKKHIGHKVKDHGLGSHTVVDFETASYSWKLEVIKYEFKRIRCLDCKVWLSPKGGWSIPKGSLYGYRIRAAVISWRMSLGISYGDCAKIIRSLFSLCDDLGTPIPIPNKDTMKNWVLQASSTFSPQFKSLHQGIQRSKVLYIDETPISLNGECWFVWVLCSEKSYYYLLKSSKGLEALKEVVVGCEPMAVVSDDAAVYTAKRLRELMGEQLELQKCVVHIYRVLGKSLRTIISKLKKGNSTNSADAEVLTVYQQKLLKFIPEFIKLFSKDTRSDAEAGLLKIYQELELPMKGNLKSIWEHRNELFVYKDPKYKGKLQKTNNMAEAGMRIVARMRKRIRCFRSEKCLQAELSILSLYATVSSRKEDFTKFILDGLQGNLPRSFEVFEAAEVYEPPPDHPAFN